MRPKFLLKGAVVAMAAFGAFAFNGNANDQASFTRSDTCESINAECSNSGGETCRVEISPNYLVDVYDFECSIEIKHETRTPVPWDIE